MKCKSFTAAMLAAILLITLTACGKTQSPAVSDKSGSAPQHAEQQNDVETSANEYPAASGDAVSDSKPVSTDAENAPEEDSEDGSEEDSEEAPWQTALAEDLLDKYGVLPEHYEDLGDGIYQVYVEIGGEIVPFVAVNAATGDYHG